MIGKKFDRLTVVSEVPKDQRIGGKDARKRKQYYCQCECGAVTIVSQANLAAGRTRSCGCIAKEWSSYQVNAIRPITHGLTCREPDGRQPRLYRIWKNMKQRCYYLDAPYYKNYGGRGITICDEWKNSFEAFHEWAISNGYRDDLTIDRINVNGNYEPNNCRWATIQEQAENKRK